MFGVNQAARTFGSIIRSSCSHPATRASPRMVPDTSYSIRSSNNVMLQISKRYSIVEGTEGTHKPSPFQQKVLVWGKIYPSVDQIPERVTRNQMKKGMDKFRVRCSVWMVAMTFIFAALMALVGRKARQDGQTVTKNSLEQRRKQE